MAIECTECGHKMSNAQAIAQIGTKTIRDVFGLNCVGSSPSAGIASHVVAGLAVESDIRCPKCRTRGCFRAAWHMKLIHIRYTWTEQKFIEHHLTFFPFKSIIINQEKSQTWNFNITH